MTSRPAPQGAAAHAQRTLRIGLTGGIGSGKSTVAGVFVQLGAGLIDTDALARSLTAPGGAAMPAIESAFGPQAIRADGGLDREHMRSLAFADLQARRRLEAILHPMIAEQTRLRAEVATQTTLVFDVPLLVESGHWRHRVDKVLVVDCSEETQIERVMARSGWSRAAVQAVIAQQASREARRACADAVIHNDDGLGHAQLADRVRALWSFWGCA